jgi:hypothetical protein
MEEGGKERRRRVRRRAMFCSFVFGQVLGFFAKTGNF